MGYFHVYFQRYRVLVTPYTSLTERIESDKSMGVVQLKNGVRLMKQDMKLLQDTVEMFDDSLSSALYTSSAKAASLSKKSKKLRIPLLVLMI